MIKKQFLQKAAEDFRYLLNRGYPRRSSLEMVGNRYRLTFDERHLLHRGVFCKEDSERRRAKIISPSRIKGKDLAIDGYNVIITLEAGLSGLPLILGDDGFIRDISGLSRNYRRSKKTEKALRLILAFLKRVKPRFILFLFDAPISKSGELADRIRKLLKVEAIPGNAQAIKVPEEILIGFSGVVATTDTAILDHARQAVDLAGAILRREGRIKALLRWGKRPGGKARIPRS